LTVKLRLGVNIDHIATIRNARGGSHPDPLRAALEAESAGADGITVHLREDRRHIVEDDIRRLKDNLTVPLNLEIAPTKEMLDIALKYRPHAVCFVPEKREERTTEGGLNLVSGPHDFVSYVETLSDAGIKVAAFVEPETEQVQAATIIGASVIELHTGAYCDSISSTGSDVQFRRIKEAADLAKIIGLECHAGHGLNFDTVGPIAAIPTLSELNIGHFLVGEGVLLGLKEAIRRMRFIMEASRTNSDSGDLP